MASCSTCTEPQSHHEKRMHLGCHGPTPCCLFQTLFVGNRLHTRHIAPSTQLQGADLDVTERPQAHALHVGEIYKDYGLNQNCYGLNPNCCGLNRNCCSLTQNRPARQLRRQARQRAGYREPLGGLLGQQKHLQMCKT